MSWSTALSFIDTCVPVIYCMCRSLFYLIIVFCFKMYVLTLYHWWLFFSYSVKGKRCSVAAWIIDINGYEKSLLTTVVTHKPDSQSSPQSRLAYGANPPFNGFQLWFADQLLTCVFIPVAHCHFTGDCTAKELQRAGQCQRALHVTNVIARKEWDVAIERNISLFTVRGPPLCKQVGGGWMCLSICHYLQEPVAVKVKALECVSSPAVTKIHLIVFFFCWLSFWYLKTERLWSVLSPKPLLWYWNVSNTVHLCLNTGNDRVEHVASV